MLTIELPISKSIANRILLLQAIHGDELMPVSAAMPDDVRVLHDALTQLREYKQSQASSNNSKQAPLVLNLKNCGTALRFLQVHLQVCYPGEPITLDGDTRLKERDGKPTSQTASAWLMHGRDIPFSPDESPYITMTRRVMESYNETRLEADWSAAAFWYEYVAIHGGEMLLNGLTDQSIQGDRIVADLYAGHFGVTTTFTPEGAILQAKPVLSQSGPAITPPYNEAVTINFTNCPDLYPAIALTCERLGVELIAIGTERLHYKESDRLEAVRMHEVRNDHRIAMALLAADYPVSETDQKCIAKSYPQFVSTWTSIQQLFPTVNRRSADGQPTVKADLAGTSIDHITPIRGVNDDGLGKKHALSKLIHASSADYLWLHDDDVIWPKAAKTDFDLRLSSYDLVILPLRMECDNPNLLERLQIAEYAAIQELTMRTAEKGSAVMCSGANLIVRRQAWLECEPDLHPDVPSGDDMFLLEAAKRRGMRIGVLDEPDYTAVVQPASTWRAFFRQRTRWAGKAPHYTDKDIRRCGALIVAANILQVLCPPILLIKFPIEYRLILKREPQTSWFVALLLEVVYPFYMLVSLLGGMLRRREW